MTLDLKGPLDHRAIPGLKDLLDHKVIQGRKDLLGHKEILDLKVKKVHRALRV